MLPWSGMTDGYPFRRRTVRPDLHAPGAAGRSSLFVLPVEPRRVRTPPKGYYLSPYHFGDMSGFKTASLLTIGALLAIFGAGFGMRRRRRNA